MAKDRLDWESRRSKNREMREPEAIGGADVVGENEHVQQMQHQPVQQYDVHTTENMELENIPDREESNTVVQVPTPHHINQLGDKHAEDSITLSGHKEHEHEPVEKRHVEPMHHVNEAKPKKSRPVEIPVPNQLSLGCNPAVPSQLEQPGTQVKSQQPLHTSAKICAIPQRKTATNLFLKKYVQLPHLMLGSRASRMIILASEKESKVCETSSTTIKQGRSKKHPNPKRLQNQNVKEILVDAA